MFDLDENAPGSDSIYPTNFDILRIQSMVEGDKLDSESGNFSVLAYKNSYVLLLNNHKKKENFQEFEKVEDLIGFLRKN